MTVRLLALMICFVVFILPLDADIPEVERQALIAFYNGTGGDNWYKNDNWKKADGSFNDPGSENTWYGITCDSANTTVIAIKFRDNNINGTLPSQLASLTNLKRVIISRNYPGLDGYLFTENYNLRYLDLSRNWIDEPLPAEIGYLSQLTYLDFSCNDGPYNANHYIPASLGNLANLEYLNLCFYGFDQPIPSELANLTHLKYLDISRNDFGGSIPPWLGNFTDLEVLNLSGCYFIGPIPEEIVSLTDLRVLDLGFNRIYGEIPGFIGTLVNLEHLDLSMNDFVGPIPDSFSQLTRLKYLDLRINDLAGLFPQYIGNFPDLEYLDIGPGFGQKNQLTGSLPHSIGNLVKLEELLLEDNLLSGPIPAEIGTCENLVIFNAWNNHLSGDIPLEMGMLQKLRGLYLGNNQLSGSLPSQLAQLENLEYLNVSNNSIGGPIPPEFGNLDKVRHLLLGGNRLSGKIPAELASMSSLYRLHLGHNSLSGQIPVELSNHTCLCILSIFGNQLSGVLPESFHNILNNTCSGYHCECFISADFNALDIPKSFLNTSLYGMETQTLVPENVSAVIEVNNKIKVSWVPITYYTGSGSYQVFYRHQADRKYTYAGETETKAVNSFIIDKLPGMGGTYYIVVRSKTNPHGWNGNTVFSKFSEEVEVVSGISPCQGK